MRLAFMKKVELVLIDELHSLKVKLNGSSRVVWGEFRLLLFQPPKMSSTGRLNVSVSLWEEHVQLTGSRYLGNRMTNEQQSPTGA